VLVENGLAPDFVAQLGRGMDALKVSVDSRGAARAKQVSATKQLTTSLGLGKQYVQIMDAALTKALKSDPAKLAEWKNARRVTIKGVTTPALVVTPTKPGGTPTPDAKAA
jgi:hypothetical protein